MNKKKLLNWVLLLIYSMVHLVLTLIIMEYAAVGFPLASEHFRLDLEDFFCRFSVVLAFVYNIGDFCSYSLLLKKIKAHKIYKLLIFIGDIAICIHTCITFLSMNVLLFLAQSCDIKEATHWIWVVCAIATFAAFMYMRIKAFIKTQRRHEDTERLETTEKD